MGLQTQYGNMLERGSSTLEPFVDRLTSRSALNAREKEAIISLPTRTVNVGRNQHFLHAGEQCDYSSMIVAGLVARFEHSRNSGMQITALHIAGDMPDLGAVVQQAPTSSLQALSAATILQVPRSAIADVAAKYPRIAEALWRDCMLDASILSQWVMNTGRRDARARIAHLFCEMAVRLGATSRNGSARFNLPITQFQLADATGLTSVHVNRSLMALRGEGLTVRSSMVLIQDWERLKKVADFDPAYLQLDAKPAQPSPLNGTAPGAFMLQPGA